MSNNFQQTVNLKDRLNRSEPAPGPARASKPNSSLRGGKPKPAPEKIKKPAEDIDEVYTNSEAQVKDQPDLRTFSRPQSSKREPGVIFRWLSAVLTLIIIAIGAYFIFFQDRGRGEVAGETVAAARWYAVKLSGGEIYYGQIIDIKSDPVEIKNVYYNYDQLNEGKETSDSGNLRLIKRGQETHGPEGTMSIIRSQVVFMEPLKEDSKVLRAILDYEQ